MDPLPTAGQSAWFSRAKRPAARTALGHRRAQPEVLQEAGLPTLASMSWW